MTDQPSRAGSTLTTADPAAAPARVARAFTPVESAMGLMDTARFEHLGRVANVMARAGLMPVSLTHVKQGTGDNAPLVELPFEVIQARAYLIANQADLWHADPNAVAQCTSIVHGKLMYEGKLVHGIISAKLGVDLIYEFGRYDAALRDIKGKRDPETGEWHGEMPGADDKGLGVRVLGTLPGEVRPRSIAGSVGMWETTGNRSPWSKSTAWMRQLRYMGAREWCRAHKPSLLLGILTDDEVDEYELARSVAAVGPAPPQALHAGFEDRPRQTVIEGPAKPARRARKGSEEQAADPPVEETASETVATPAVEPEPEPEQVSETPAEEVVETEDEAADQVAEPEAEDEADEEPAADPVDSPDASDAQDEDENLPPEFKAYIDAVEAAKDFASVKTCMIGFYNTDLFKGMAPPQQNAVRANTWAACVENNVTDLPDPAGDVSAFRLWIEWIEDPDAIVGTLQALDLQPAFAQKGEDFREAIHNAAKARVGELRGEE